MILQMICLPVGPRCNSCDLSGGLCPSANQSKGASQTKVRGKKVVGTATIVEEATPMPGAGGPKIEISVEEEEAKLEES